MANNRSNYYFIRVLRENVVIWRQVVIVPLTGTSTTCKSLQAIVTIRKTNQLLANAFPVIEFRAPAL